MNTADRYLLELATATTKHGGLIDRRAKRFVPAVLERMKIAGAFSRQLAQLGVEKASMPLPTFDELLRQPEPPTTNVHEPEEPTP